MRFSAKLAGSIAVIALGASLNSGSARAETTECTEITSVPTVITNQGVYCLKKHLSMSLASGKAIDIQANNVIIDMNGYKLGGLHAGPGSAAVGIYAGARKNVTIRNGTIRGFFRGIFFSGATGSGHVVEDVKAESNLYIGMWIDGQNSLIRNNQIINSGSREGGTTALGLAIRHANNSVVTGNLVSGVSESGLVRGIYVEQTAAAEISENMVLNLEAGTTRHGIQLKDATNITLFANRFINPGSGSTAILDAGTTTGVDCIANIIRGYSSATDGCSYASHNHVN